MKFGGTAKFMAGFARAQSGLAAVEFGLILPVLMTLFYGTIEVSRFVLITQKVEKLAHSVADVTSQEEVATKTVLDQVMSASTDIMNPYSMTNNGKIYITSVYRAPSTTNASVLWRYQSGSLASVASKLGTVGSTPTMPASFTFDERENVIAAEVYYQFSPLISTKFFGTTTIYRAAFYKPRFGGLLVAPA